MAAAAAASVRNNTLYDQGMSVNELLLGLLSLLKCSLTCEFHFFSLCLHYQRFVT